MNWKRGLRYLYLRFIRLHATPPEIARGFAFGVFWGMFPLPGLQIAIAVVTAAVFRSSKLAAAAGTWLSNPITTLPFTALNFHVGQWALGREWRDLPPGSFDSLEEVLNLGSEFITSYLMGCLIVGSCMGILAYVLGLPTVAAIRRSVENRRSRRRRLKRLQRYGIQSERRSRVS